MERRSTDVLRRQIADSERLLAEYRALGQTGLQYSVERDIARLRAQLAAEESPERFGRRATDGATVVPDRDRTRA